MIENLRLKLQDKEFCTDVAAMIKTNAPSCDPQVAGRLVIEKLLFPLCENTKEDIDAFLVKEKAKLCV